MKENTGTVDFGIDLGTTTSSIAKVEGNDTIVVPNELDNMNFVYSAVYIAENETKYFGNKAKNQIVKDSKNGFAEFKLRMGSDYIYEFESSGLEMTPVELSSEILKYLKRSVQKKYNQDIDAAVITVPADFDAPQNRDTSEAAKLAGFEQVILLQEPTAAAIAYGFDSSAENEMWLIYDLGGGTFDVSIMQKTKEEIINRNNDGDSYLGGKLIDWDIVDKILVPIISEEVGLKDFERRNKKYESQFAKLKKAAETLKIDLSNHFYSEVEIENLKIDGKDYDFDFEVNRNQLNEIMKPYVDRTINHCKNAIDGADITVEDISKIILVGGSSLSPYIHDRLKDEFGVPLEFSIDPITVVARGAAMYAGTIHKTNMDNNYELDKVTLEVEYDTVGVGVDFDVMGKILDSDANPVSGYSIEFINKKTLTSSGQLKVSDDGLFMTSLIAEDEDDINLFEIKVYDDEGNIASLSSNSVNTIKYKIGVTIGKPILSHSIGIGLIGNKFEIIAEEGQELPFLDYHKSYLTTSLVRANHPGDQFYMPLYEGNFPKADRNNPIGHITVTGDMIPKDLPENSEVELILNIDETLNYEPKVFITSLNLELPNAWTLEKEKSKYEDLIQKFNEQQERYLNLNTKAVEIDNQLIMDNLKKIEDENIIGNINTFLKTSQTDLDALYNAGKRINQLTAILDEIEDMINWYQLKKEIEDYKNKLDQDSRIQYNPQLKEEYDKIMDMYNNAIDLENEEMLSVVKEKIQDFYALLNRDILLVEEFRNFYTVFKYDFINKQAANELIQAGENAIANGDINELIRIFNQLIKLLPADIQKQLEQSVEDSDDKDSLGHVKSMDRYMISVLNELGDD